METHLQISGMTCGHCVQGVTKSLQNVPGVQLVVVDLASGRALIQHEENADTHAMIAAVEEEGHSALLKHLEKPTHEQ